MSRQTATKWLHRYRAEARRTPRSQLGAASDRPLAACRDDPGDPRRADELGQGPHRLARVVEVPRSTIGDVLRRHGLSRLRDRDRPTGIPIRYVRERPGELVHVDVKKLGRIPDGGGHRVHGRAGTPRAHAGYDYVHVAVVTMHPRSPPGRWIVTLPT